MSLSFKPELMEKVLSGEKTVTRRGWPTNYKPGQVVSIVPGMGRIACGKVRIVSVTKSDLDFDLDEANREGFPNYTAFQDYWIRLHGSFPTPDFEDFIVARIEFEMIDTQRTICKCCEGIGTLPTSGGDGS